MCWRLCMGLLCGQSAGLLSRGRGQPSWNVSLRPCGPGSSPVLSAGSWPRRCLAGGHGWNLHSLWPVGPPVLFRWLFQCLKGRNLPHFVCWTHPSSVLYTGIARGWGGWGEVCPPRTQPRLPGTWAAALPLSSRAPSIPACSPLRPVISAAPSTTSSLHPFCSQHGRADPTPASVLAACVTLEMTLPLGWASHFMQDTNDMWHCGSLSYTTCQINIYVSIEIIN